MKDIYLTNYSVKGIKTLDETVSLSFYKKTITKDMDTQEYNIKGIYGMNGSGKSGIMTSVEILRNLLLDSGYLSDPVTQNSLDALVNKRIGELAIGAEIISKMGGVILQFQYNVTLGKDSTGKFVIIKESLHGKPATSKKDNFITLFDVANGEVDYIYANDKSYGLACELEQKSVNLLSTASMIALFREKVLALGHEKMDCLVRSNSEYFLADALCVLVIFSINVYVYLDQSDNHRKFLTNKSFANRDIEWKRLLDSMFHTENEWLDVISISENYVPKTRYVKFENTIEKLCEFIRIFKADLQNIEIDKKENHEYYVCDLIMVYDSYKIHAEFESTGIKKLIRLFAFIREMVNGGIVFIDEFDSNLHDVYLCALLEYLMQYGEGQLCFTTHNVGPMDILKQNKKSIDFLSEDHKIYPWRTNGNYSPSKLYRNGMIEGSPFNVDAIDFIGVFGTGEEDE